MTCPLTTCGFEAPDPIGADAVTACGSLDSERYATLDDLARHPKGCHFEGFEDLVADILGAVSGKIDDHYGRSVAPCEGVRCYPSVGGRVPIAPLLRLDAIETRPSGCDPCSEAWTELDLCDVVVGSRTDLPPWHYIERCGGASFAGLGVRVTGVWGDAWPVHPGIKTAAIVVTAKLWQSIKSNQEIIANPADGTTRIQVPDFTMDELSLLPRSLVRYRAEAA